jgi:glycosyltransferase involved in cell wall biosynthesis
VIVLGAPGLGFQGGVERHVFDLAGGLRQRGHRVALIHGDTAGRDGSRYAQAFDAVEPVRRAGALLRGARVVYLHKLQDPALLEAVPAAAKLVLAIHDHDATCVRSHRYLPLSRTPCTRAPGLDCIAHGCVVVRRRGSLVPLTLCDPFALARATRSLAERALLVACSEFLRGTLVDAGVPPDRVQVVRPVPPEDPAPLVEVPTAPILAFVGQIVRGKGLDLLLEALPGVPGATLIVAGAGPSLAEEQQRAIRLGLQSRVSFLGSVAPDRVREIYDRARVVVVPSRWPEPFGMIGVEAMRRRRLVVAARHGGIPEWLTDGVNGVAFEPCNVADLARALRLAVNHPRYDALVAAGDARAHGEFRFEAMVDRVERVLGLGV